MAGSKAWALRAVHPSYCDSTSNTPWCDRPLTRVDGASPSPVLASPARREIAGVLEAAPVVGNDKGGTTGRLPPWLGLTSLVGPVADARDEGTSNRPTPSEADALGPPSTALPAAALDRGDGGMGGRGDRYNGVPPEARVRALARAGLLVMEGKAVDVSACRRRCAASDECGLSGPRQ